MTAPLDGLLIADFSRVLAGPLATAMLADLGAEVVKVERPGVGDDTRHWGPPWTAGSSSYFECANRSKRSVELDLKDPDDLGLARELARRADILVENHRSGVLDRLGLGYRGGQRGQPGDRLLLHHRVRRAAPVPTCPATTSSSRPWAVS